MGKEDSLTILSVSGPYREPREPVFSYDFSVQRPSWPTCYGTRVKVAIAEELDIVRDAVLGPVTGSPGQQLLVNQFLSRRIAEQKLRIAEAEGLLSERQEVLIPPFTGPAQHLFPRLQEWVKTEQAALREEIKSKLHL